MGWSLKVVLRSRRVASTTTEDRIGHMPTDTLNDIELLIRSRYGLIYLDTPEEDRANGLLAHVADRLGLPFFTWTRSQGLSRRPGRHDLREP
jgi:hypothetical protein